MLIVENATTPAWADADHTAINLTVKFESFDEAIPFCAHPDDVEPHGRELYQRAILGEFGSIAEYVAPSLDEIKAAKWKEIKAERDRRVQLGGYKVGQHWYQSDTFSRTQQIGLVVMGANIPGGLQWKTYDNGFVTMTQTLANQIFAAAATQDAANFAAAATHKAAMEASEDPANYDFSQGWPESYEP